MFFLIVCYLMLATFISYFICLASKAFYLEPIKSKLEPSKFNLRKINYDLRKFVCLLQIYNPVRNINSLLHFKSPLLVHQIKWSYLLAPTANIHTCGFA